MIATTLQKELDTGDRRSVITVVDSLIEDAYNLRASDIHLDPEESDTQVRFRIDGVLQDVQRLAKDLHLEVVARVKILARMRTDEHQAPQDGRFRIVLRESSKPVDMRVSIMPTFYGENIVMRLLVNQDEAFTLDNIGLTEANRKLVAEAIQKPYGMILVTGPTGSGKTTTLYSLVKVLNSRDRSIITIEDPIEYSIVGINQIQVNARTELTFANGLRSMLRQDPNVIMLGEIRDAETAGLAVNTALTGHLLLSTLHTNDAATALPRLLDMKAEAYLIASTVNIVVAQRLVRKLCPDCREEREASEAELTSLEDVVPKKLLTSKRKLYSAKGCEKCGKTGYRGRIGVQEVLPIRGPVRDAILAKASASEIRQIAIAQGMVSITEDGFRKAMDGATTVEEILRIQHE